MHGYKVRFTTPWDARAQKIPQCIECHDPTEVIYTYDPVLNLTIKVPYCFDCAAEHGIIEMVKDRMIREPVSTCLLPLRKNTDLARYAEGTWWVVDEGV